MCSLHTAARVTKQGNGNFWGSSSQSMLKAGSLAQCHVPVGLNISKDGDSITSLCQYSTTFVCTKEAFSRWNFPFSSLYSVPLVLSLGITEKRLLPSLQPSLRYLCTLKSFLFQAEQCHLSQCIPIHQILEFFKHLQGSSLDMFCYLHWSTYWSPELDTALQICPTCRRETSHSPGKQDRSFQTATGKDFLMVRKVKQWKIMQGDYEKPVTSTSA